MRRVMRLLPLAALLTAPPALAEIYKCVDPASGHTTYANVPLQGCKRLNLDPVSTVPAVKPPAAATPQNFPRVDDNVQKNRDAERRRILEQELTNEQAGLNEAQKALREQEGIILPNERNAGGAINGAKVEERLQGYRDRVAQHERNIASLKKELANAR